MGNPRLYTIPGGQPFLDTLAQAVLNGDLPVTGGAAPDRLALSRWTILLPTRRAARALSDAFLHASGGDAMLLPQIRPIGDVEEDVLALSPLPEAASGDLALSLDPAIGMLERRIALTQLIMAWSSAISQSAAEDGFRAPATPAQAATLAAQLGAFMDLVDIEKIDLTRLADLVPDQFAEHWQQTLEFLKIVTEHWPAHLAENKLLAPYARRDALMELETERLIANPPEAPVIAAGSTATVPATARLLETISKLESGAVVLPGLDQMLDEESWKSIGEGDGHPEHPQFGMQQFLKRLGVTRDHVMPLGDQRSGGLVSLYSQTMRPPGTTEHWQSVKDHIDRDVLKERLESVSRIDAPTEPDEAEVIALLLRKAAQEPRKVAALVTPDRVLARRVSVQLGRWGLRVDDSAGIPLSGTLPGSFMEALAEAAHSGLAPVPLLALLKHPMCLFGQDAKDARRMARLFELTVLRQPAVGHGIAAYRRALSRTRASAETRHTHRLIRKLSKADWDAIEALLDELEAVFAPLLCATAQKAGDIAFKEMVKAHVEAAQAFAAGPDGASAALWRGEAGESLHGFVSSLLQAEGQDIFIARTDYFELWRTFIAGVMVRPRIPTHPRLHIWGPLEARLQCPDMIILAGLNEGTWPATVETDPWLSRVMRSQIGLSAPERQIGLAAHDFVQLASAPEVWLTRSEKKDGSPTVPSRWLLRLDAVLDALGSSDALKAKDDWLGWARARDWSEELTPVAAPAPCPPLDARPSRLSVTRIEAWIKSPYAIFAQDIMGLAPLEELASEPDARLKGNILHQALMQFTSKHEDALPEAVVEAVMLEANVLLDALGDNAQVQTFWHGQMANFARWFAATEPARRAGVMHIRAEVPGEIALGDFTLSARADRIDVCEDGTLRIYDYKTGVPPTPTQVESAQAPQLSLEAAIASHGGFEAVPAETVSKLAYIRAHGHGTGGSESVVSTKLAPETLAEQAIDKLQDLIKDFADPAQPYVALRRGKFSYRYDTFAHLARVQEWASDAGGRD